MRNAVIARALLLLMATAANAASLLKYELQLDAVARGNGAYSRHALIPQDNRYDDDWIIITWERTRLHFAVENRSGAPLRIDWNGASLQLDDEPAQRVIHGGVMMKDRRLPQPASLVNPWRNQCDGVIPARNVYYNPSAEHPPRDGFDPLFGGGGWGWSAKPLIPVIVGGDPREAVANVAQHVIAITLPIVRRGVTRRYRFRLVPANVTATDTVFAQNDGPRAVEPADSDDDKFWYTDYEPTSDEKCNPHSGADERVYRSMTPADLFQHREGNFVRTAFDHAPRRDYLVAYYSSWNEELEARNMLEIIDVRGKPRVLAKRQLPRGWDYREVSVHDVNHDGWPEIVTTGWGGRVSYFTMWRWTGTHIVPMVGRERRLLVTFPEGEFIDVDHDGVDEIVVDPGGPPFERPEWPADPWRIYRLAGSRFELWRQPDFLGYTDWRWKDKDFAAHHLAAPRVMTIENMEYDDSPAPELTVELNGKVIARPRDFAAKKRVLRFPVRLEEWNIVCADGPDPVQLAITIEPAEK